MAIYQLSMSVVSRGNAGKLTTRNAVVAAAYQAREALYDERQQTVREPKPAASDLVSTEILLPDAAPYRWFDREVLWNEVEAREHRKDAQLARSVILTLPRELSDGVAVDLARDFFYDTFVRRGMVADIAVHNKVAKDKGPQPHAHALLTMRRIVDGAFGLKERAWNSAAVLNQWREQWSEMANRRLAEHGVSARLDHRRWFLWSKLPEPKQTEPKQTEERHPVRDAARLARVAAIIAAATVTQAMRDVAWKFVRRERGKPVPVNTVEQKTPIDELREELRRPLREAAVGVAAGAWTYGEAMDRLVGDHLLPATKRSHDLGDRFEELEEKIGNALAKRVERLQEQIEGNAARLRQRAELREGVVSDRVNDVDYVQQVSERLGVPNGARMERIMQTPEFKEMEARIEQRISASSTGETGSLSVETSQADRDRAWGSARVSTLQADLSDGAARQAQASVDRSHVLTAG